MALAVRALVRFLLITHIDFKTFSGILCMSYMFFWSLNLTRFSMNQVLSQRNGLTRVDIESRVCLRR